jgi:hypothetical protein
MPLFIPFILGGVAIAGSLFGAKKGYDGVSDMREAQRIGDEAKDRYDRNLSVLDAARQRVNVDADRFGNYKLEVARDTCSSLVRLLEELQRRGKLTSFEHLEGLDFAPEAFVAELREVSNTAASILGGAAIGAVKGSLTGAAVYGLAGTIGVASTGAAIGGLSGAAATSATLAWLGGGALAAGGFGMLGGMIVLGGIIAMPVFLITGFSVASEGAKALTQAKQYQSDVHIAIEKMDAMNAVLRQIRARMTELTEVIGNLRERTDAATNRVWVMVDTYDEHNRTHSALLAAAMNLAKGLKDLLSAPVIQGNDGAVNPAIPDLIARSRRLMP